MSNTELATVELEIDEHSQCLIAADQQRLPNELSQLRLLSFDDILTALSQRQLRGAITSSIAAAYALAFAVREDAATTSVTTARTLLSTACLPTQLSALVLGEMTDALVALSESERAAAAMSYAKAFDAQCRADSRALAKHGVTLIEAAAASKPEAAVNILTHGHVGKLAASGLGSALAPVYQAVELGLSVHVWVCESRPDDLGALSAWELEAHGIAHTLIADSASASLIQHDEVDLCLLECEAISAEGDVCAMVGSYPIALAAFDNHVPLCMVAHAPYFEHLLAASDTERSESFRLVMAEQSQLTQEHHRQGEQAGRSSYAPAYDYTPAKYLTTLLTARGFVAANEQAIRAVYQAPQSSVAQ